MIFVGTLSNNEANLPTLTIKEYFSENSKVDFSLRKKIVKYLRSGVYIAGVMNIVRDVFTTEEIDGAAYLTDGKYIWPIYFPYYLEKYPEKVVVPPGFIDHLVSNDFKIPGISKYKTEEITNFFFKKWQGK
ncbi:MAG: hypothetical protein H6551_05895 [Chitinophagales bacterium]|nr:hypothetical protein [Chitinophagaceae bacterium]MCB9064664.1 hypothetical protein [Chitinophagales bacterium]